MRFRSYVCVTSLLVAGMLQTVSAMDISKQLDMIASEVNVKIEKVDQLLSDSEKNAELEKIALDSVEKMKESLQEAGFSESDIETWLQDFKTNPDNGLSPNAGKLQGLRQLLVKFKGDTGSLSMSARLLETAEAMIFPPEQSTVTVTDIDSTKESQITRNAKPSPKGFFYWVLTGHIPGVTDTGEPEYILDDGTTPSIERDGKKCHAKKYNWQCGKCKGCTPEFKRNGNGEYIIPNPKYHPKGNLWGARFAFLLLLAVCTPCLAIFAGTMITCYNGSLKKFWYGQNVSVTFGLFTVFMFASVFMFFVFLTALALSYNSMLYG